MNAIRSFSCLVGLFFLLSMPTAAQSPTDDEIVSRIGEYMEAAQKIERFSGTILVARNGKPIISRGYGMANIEWNIPNAPNTVFRLGSVTKQFTAAAIMLLEERGKLSVNDPLCKFVSECPAAWQPITLRHLLTHTAGIPNYTSFPGFFEKKGTLPVTPPELLAEFRDKPLDFAVGERYAYSNSGYHVLGIVIEKASGKTYDEFLRENIFKPLGMNSSGYDFSRDIIKHRASGYQLQGSEFVNAQYLDMWIPYAAGSLYSTTEDLLIWDQALYTEKLLKKASLDAMFMPFKGTYGYGWNISSQGGRKSISHGGGIHGFVTNISRFPDDKVTVIVLCNFQGSSVGKVTNTLSAIVFGEKYELPKERKEIALAPEKLDQFVGVYQLGQTATLTITKEDGKLYLSVPAQPKLELFPESETDFFLKAADAQVSFVKDDNGNVTQLLFKQGGGRGAPATKVK